MKKCPKSEAVPRVALVKEKSIRKMNPLLGQKEEYDNKLLIEVLKGGIKRQRSFSDLKISFPLIHKDHITYNQMQNLLSTLKSVKSLSIYFYALESTRRCHEKRISSLRNFKSLLQLDINLRAWMYHEDWSDIVRELSSNLSDLKLLKVFELRCVGTFNQQCTQSLYDAIGNLRSLSTLRLDLGFEQITDHTVILLSSALKNLKLLTSLAVCFYSDDEFTDKGLESLSSAVMSLKLLSHLELYFGDCELITDQGLKSLAIALHNLQHLSNLHLDLSNSYDNHGGCTTFDLLSTEKS